MAKKAKIKEDEDDDEREGGNGADKVQEEHKTKIQNTNLKNNILNIKGNKIYNNSGI